MAGIDDFLDRMPAGHFPEINVRRKALFNELPITSGLPLIREKEAEERFRPQNGKAQFYIQGGLNISLSTSVWQNAQFTASGVVDGDFCELIDTSPRDTILIKTSGLWRIEYHSQLTLSSLLNVGGAACRLIVNNDEVIAGSEMSGGVLNLEEGLGSVGRTTFALLKQNDEIKLQALQIGALTNVRLSDNTSVVLEYLGPSNG